MSISYGERSDTSTTSDRLERALDTQPGDALDMAAATVRQEHTRRRMARRVVDEKQWGEIRRG